MPTQQQYAYFALTGDFDPATITARVGVAPTECWRRGELCPRRQVARTFSRWKLVSRLSREQPLEAHIADVLAQLDANSEAFATVAREYGGVMQLVGHFQFGYPGLYFESALIARLAHYALAVDCDFYGLDIANE